MDAKFHEFAVNVFENAEIAALKNLQAKVFPLYFCYISFFASFFSSSLLCEIVEYLVCTIAGERKIFFLFCRVNSKLNARLFG
jgi:hypothetical protein